MSVKMQIDKDGNLVFQDTKVKLGELIRYNGVNLVDGYNNVVDIANLLGDIFNNEDTQIVERALLADDTLKVGGTLAADVLTKLNYKNVIPVTPLPLASLPAGVVEGNVVYGNITNFDMDTTYIINVDLGEVSLDMGGKLIYKAPNVMVDSIATFNIIGIANGAIRSEQATYSLKIFKYISDGDQTLTNSDYQSFEIDNDGFSY